MRRNGIQYEHGEIEPRIVFAERCRIISFQSFCVFISGTISSHVSTAVPTPAIRSKLATRALRSTCCRVACSTRKRWTSWATVCAASWSFSCWFFDAFTSSGIIHKRFYSKLRRLLVFTCRSFVIRFRVAYSIWKRWALWETVSSSKSWCMDDSSSLNSWKVTGAHIFGKRRQFRFGRAIRSEDSPTFHENELFLFKY